MAAYHHLTVHFPIALWTTAALIVLLRTFSNGALARNAAKVLTPLVALGVASGIVAFITGFLVFPIETLTASPLGRNHLLVASWSLAYWALLLVISWRLGEAAWNGLQRWIMLGLAALGGGLYVVTGALGGHLAGAPSAMSQLFRLFGWEVYTTAYVPNFMLVLLLIAAAAMAVAGMAGRTYE
jgi:hypothetical protein